MHNQILGQKWCYDPGMLKLISDNKFYHITHPIEDVKNHRKKLSVLPIDDNTWINVGQRAEFRKAVERM